MQSQKKRRVAKFVLGLWIVGAALSAPSAALASHQCAGIEVWYWCPFVGPSSVCVADAHGESHACLDNNRQQR